MTAAGTVDFTAIWRRVRVAGTFRKKKRTCTAHPIQSNAGPMLATVAPAHATTGVSTGSITPAFLIAGVTGAHRAVTSTRGHRWKYLRHVLRILVVSDMFLRGFWCRLRPEAALLALDCRRP
jgi:hypothetical protein